MRLPLMSALLLAALPPAGQGYAGPAVPDTASAAADTVLLLPPIEVSEARPENDPGLRLRPGFARAYDVSRSHGRLRMVSDVLTGAVGVRVRQFGGVGSFSTVSVRGSSSNQVAVYLDGVPLNSAQYGVVNLGDVPIEALDRVEVYRGAAPLVFESPGGGVINLVSRRSEGLWGRAAAGRGSFGSDRGDVAVGARRGRRAASVVAQYLKSDGTFPYFDDNATPFNLDDDTTRTRENNRIESRALTASAEQGLGPLVVSVTRDQLAKNQGTPGTGANPALQARLKTDRAITNLLLRWSPQGHVPPAELDRWALRLFMVGHRDRFADPAGELTGLRQDNDNQTSRRGGQLHGSLRLPLHQTLTLNAEGRREVYAPRLNLPTPQILPPSRRRYWVAGAEHQWTLFAGRIGLLGRVRRQITTDDFAGGRPYPGALPVPASDRTVYQTSWTAGGRLDLVAGLSAKGSVSRLLRMPTLEELFGNAGGVYGDPRLKPETITTHDVGLAWFFATKDVAPRARPAWIEGQLSWYRSDAQDLLVFFPNSLGLSVAQNVSAARLSGLELGLRAAWHWGLSSDASWTRQWARDEGQVAYWRGKDLPGRPRDEASMCLSMARRLWKVSYEMHYVSANYLDRYNTVQVPGRRLHDVGVGWRPWAAGPEWIAECRNLTDRRVEDFAGYPLPGRMFFFGLRTQLDRKEHPHAAQRQR